MVLDYSFYFSAVFASAWRQKTRSESGKRVVKSVLASLPGGDGKEKTRSAPADHNNAYKHAQKRFSEMGFDTAEALGTVWFGRALVWGKEVTVGSDTWTHPVDRECGRDGKSLADAPNSSDIMWKNVEAEGKENRIKTPVPDQPYKCWCCQWMRKFDQVHADGCELHVVFSNISCWAEPILAKKGTLQEQSDDDPEYARALVRAYLNIIESINTYGAGFSLDWPEIRDGLVPRIIPYDHHFRAKIDVDVEKDRVELRGFNRELSVVSMPLHVVSDLLPSGSPGERFRLRAECVYGAREHPDTGKPLGDGCRWERRVLDAKPYKVWAYEFL